MKLVHMSSIIMAPYYDLINIDPIISSYVIQNVETIINNFIIQSFKK